jgi:NAD(P)-dependent dehydrogenase (short-subunit alcohol dehydrogenase family)
VYDTHLQLTALKRWGDPDEVAAVMEFLIGPGASYMTGSAVLVDGGWTTGHQVLRHDPAAEELALD